MSLKAILAKAVQSAFKAADDVPHTCTYRALQAGSTGMSNYDVVSGTATFNGSDYLLPSVLFTKFKEDEEDNQVEITTDMRMAFPTADLPVTPNASDKVVDDLFRSWEVIRMLSDPAAVLTTLHVRTT